MKTEVLRANHPIAFKHAVDVLKNGGLVAFPTDTIYGLATLISPAETVERLYIAKGRSSERTVAVLVGSIADINQFVDGITVQVEMLIHRFWPGPLTLILPGLPFLPENLAPAGQVSVRMPDHSVALRLLQETGPLAVTSANLTGHPFASTAQDVLNQLQGRIHLVLDGGPTSGGIPSTIVDFTTDQPVVLREGPITRQDVMAALSA